MRVEKQQDGDGARNVNFSSIFVLYLNYGIRVLLFWEILWQKSLRERAKCKQI